MDSLTVNNVTNHFIKKELEGLITKEEENLIINWVTNIKKDYNYNQKLPKNLINDIQNLPYSLDRCQEKLKILYDFLSPKFKQIWEKENTEIKNLGGLFVLGTERHETRRIDNQLRGRAGRQGDPGISQFFVSLEDELIQIFGGNSIGKWVEFLIQDKDVPLESDFLTKSLENAQKKVELYNYDLRKNVFQYDEVLSLQREKIYSMFWVCYVFPRKMKSLFYLFIVNCLLFIILPTRNPKTTFCVFQHTIGTGIARYFFNVQWSIR